ncbi:hypothetical protein WMY93_033224 [Mugilogobius chulae]|uniref:Alpha-1,3-mannosyl-glycoprotein 2-beta-N-acetylglucosaminyltransferase n=1 Tax=Mugilogobius chulae TaxID=88201 RepID=A0AAW0MLR2_9GOBI
MIRKRAVILFGTFLFVSWNAVLVLLLWRRDPGPQVEEPNPNPNQEVSQNDVIRDVLKMADAFEAELERQKSILLQIKDQKLHQLLPPKASNRSRPGPPPLPVIPILVMACNRVTVRRCIDKLLQHQPSDKLHPIIVSQDCGHQDTAAVIQSVPRLLRVLPGAVPSAAVGPEPVVRVRWNDNGRDGFVDPSAASLLYRTDFFPGLGWMLLKEEWHELEPKWPAAFWDDWMRQPEQRRNRGCIRPEISRTITFGRQGVSLGQFYDKYLKFIKLNSEFVPFTKLDLSYLNEETYRVHFEKEVYSAPLVSYEDVKQGKLAGPGPFRLQYYKDGFKILAKNLGVMEDLKSGVPRASYRGVVSFMSRGKRIYLAPPPGWTYDPPGPECGCKALS